MKKLYLLIAIFCISLSVNGQGLRGGGIRGYSDTSKEKEDNTQPKISEEKEDNTQPKISEEKKDNTQPEAKIGKVKYNQSDGSVTVKQDTVYSFDTKKQHGWLEPVGILTKEQVSHRGVSIMFTNKNKKGHWTKMEIIDSYGNYYLGKMNPYVVSSDENWKEKTAKACICEFISDPSGDNIIQERAYDSNMNIIYVYSRTHLGKDKNGRNQYVGSYKDFYGLPAEMRPDTSFAYGTSVIITEDKYGNDEIIEYVDSKMEHKLNNDSAYRSVFTYDKNGQDVLFASQDKQGDYIVDLAGNSGYVKAYNSDFTLKSALCVDEKLNAMRMLSKGADERYGVIKSLYKYDKYKRLIEIKFVDAEDKDDVNGFGTHKIIYKHNDNGYTKEMIGFDLEGNLSPVDSTGVAKYVYKHDNEGRIVNIYRYGSDDMPVKGDYYSKMFYKYNDKGETIEKHFYAVNSIDNNERLWYSEIYGDFGSRITYSDGSYYIDILDTKQRETFSAYYNNDGSYNTNIRGYAYDISKYIDNGKITTKIINYYDSLGKKTENKYGVCQTITKYDSLKNVTYRKDYDINNRLISAYKTVYDGDDIIAQVDINQFDSIVRCGGNSQVVYYYAGVNYTKDWKALSFYGIDEFGETDYIYSDEVLYCYQKRDFNDYATFYDEDNNGWTEQNMDSLKNICPKVMSIEVTDSIAYNKGLRDNDVILLYGDYKADVDTVLSLIDFRKDWAAHSVFESANERDMVVFRVEDALNNKFGLVKIEGLKGTPSELGFMSHTRFLTQRQLQRIKKSIQDNIMSGTPLVSESDFIKKDITGEHPIWISYPDEILSTRVKDLQYKIVDPAIILGVSLTGRQSKWTADYTSDYNWLYEILGLQRQGNSQGINYFYTKNIGGGFSKTSIRGKDIMNDLYVVYVNDSIYNLLHKYIGYTKRIMSEDEPQNIPIKNVVGTWEIIDDIDCPVNGFISLQKDGTSTGKMSTIGYYQDNTGVAYFNIEWDYDGTYKIDGKYICINPREQENIRISFNSYEPYNDINGEQKREKDAFYRYKCSNSLPSNLIKELSFEFDRPLTNDFYVKSVNDKELTIEGGNQRILMNKVKDVDSNNFDKQDIVGSWSYYDDNYSVTLNLYSDNTMSAVCNYKQMDQQDSITIMWILKSKIKGKWKVNDNTISFSYKKRDVSGDVLKLEISGKTFNEDEYNRLLLNKKEYVNNNAESVVSQMNIFNKDWIFSKRDEGTLYIGNTCFINEKYIVKCVCGEVIEEGNPYLYRNGYRGKYYVLEWCNWNCRQTVEEFEKEFEVVKNMPKHIVLLPYSVNSNGEQKFGDIIELYCPSETLGMQLQDTYAKGIINEYNIWEMNQ